MILFPGWENGQGCNFIGLVSDGYGQNLISEHSNECRLHAAFSGKPQIPRCY